MFKLLVIMPSIATSAFHQACLMVMVPLLQEVFHLSLSEIGMVVGMGLMATAISVPAWGHLAASIGSVYAIRVILCFALLSVSAIALSFVLVNSSLLLPHYGVVMLVVARLVYSVMAPALLPIAQAIIVQNTQEPAQVLPSIGRLNSMSGLGRLAGNAMVAPLLFVSKSAPLIAPIPIYAICTFFAFRHSSPAIAKVKEGCKSDKQTTFAKRPLLVAFSLQMCLSITYVLLGPLLKERLQLDALQATGLASYCLTAAVLGGLFAQMGLLPVLRASKSAIQIASAIGVAAGLSLLCIAPTLSTIVASVTVIGASAALLSATNSVYMFNMLPAASKTKASTYLSSIQFTGLATGSLLGGFGGEWGLTHTLTIAALLAIVLCVGGSRFVISQKPVTPPLRPSDI
ncbi:MFS transporter [Pseudovibrio axinellae]|uniref:MFS transporter n=1 Tax=Pseudovibrio axinellae TaxID=989403 RepID=UPI001379945A|nr:MFS transporter [Pseudovibrio axinellae]